MYMYMYSVRVQFVYLFKAHSPTDITPENVAFLTLKSESTGEDGDGGQALSPVPTLESVVSLVTANTTDVTVAALAAVQAAAESSIKSELYVLFMLTRLLSHMYNSSMFGFTLVLVSELIIGCLLGVFFLTFSMCADSEASKDGTGATTPGSSSAAAATALFPCLVYYPGSNNYSLIWVPMDGSNPATTQPGGAAISSLLSAGVSQVH